MSYLFLLFVGFLLIFIYQYFFTGAFGLEQIWFVLLLLAGSIGAFFISRWQQNKDESYKAHSEDRSYLTRMGEMVANGKKQIYFGRDHVGTYYRFYDKSWKRFVAGLLRNPGRWYLNLHVTFSNGDTIIIRGQNETKLYGNDEWFVYQNDQIIGKIRTDLSLKNATKLREKLEVELNGKVYRFQSSSLTSDTEVKLSETTIAKGRRLDQSIKSLYEFQTLDQGLSKDEEKLLFTVYILFNYYFGQ